MNKASNLPLRCVITASTGGAVLNECLKHSHFKSMIHSVVCEIDKKELDTMTRII